jgi:succinate dehydrogenase flavin-adding protein (antitoxin of CptAB toxin-antitoxin module)
MSKSTDFMIKEMLDEARIRYQSLRDLKELDQLLNDPLLVNNKTMAADICRMLIKILVNTGIMKEGSIPHLFGLRLLDYIGRVHDESPEKLC